MIMWCVQAVRASFCRFLPLNCADAWRAETDAGSSSDASSKPMTQKQKDKRLDWAWWQVGWERYALVAVATDQLSWRSAMEHKLVCVSIAAAARADNRTEWLAVLYDELARSLKFV